MARYGNRTKTVSATTSAGLEVKLRLTLGAGGDVTVHMPKRSGGWTRDSWFHAVWTAERAFRALYFPAMAQAATEALKTLEEQRYAHFAALRAERGN